MDEIGFISLLPVIITLGTAIIFRKTFEALLAGCVAGFFLIEFYRWKGTIAPAGSEEATGEAGAVKELLLLPIDTLRQFISGLSEVMADPITVWLILIVGLIGSLISLLQLSGGALAFGEFVAKKVNSKKEAMLATWVLGLAIFIDDYMNAITVSSVMQKVTDKYKTSREMLAYVVDSTAAPVCVLVPFSTWALFTSGLLEENGVAEPGQGLITYVLLVPFNLYALVAVVLVLLVVLGIVPPLGGMKDAENRAENEGVIIPPGSENISSISTDAAESVTKENAKMINFILPIAVFMIVAWLAGLDFGKITSGEASLSDYLGYIDAQAGVIVAIIVTSFLFLFQRITTADQFSKAFFDGFKGMIVPISIVVMSFVLVSINETLGMNDYIITNVENAMKNVSGLLPAAVFLSMAFVAFSTGGFWSMYAISLPVFIPLSQSLDISTYVTAGAIISAGAFGSHLCPFGDATVLSSTGAGCDNFKHVATQAPYGIICGVIATIGYVILGFAIPGGG